MGAAASAGSRAVPSESRVTATRYSDGCSSAGACHQAYLIVFKRWAGFKLEWHVSRPLGTEITGERNASVYFAPRLSTCMPDCPLADECPSFSERIEGMGCQHYGDRGGAEWCNHYSQPIDDLKSQPVKAGESLVVDVEDIHESGAGVGRTEDGFIVLVDGVLPPARARVEISNVHSNHAKAEELERLEREEDEDTEEADAEDEDEDEETDEDDGSPRLGSRDNFWGV
jgi:predicted RNA-binding protein with TRAM domain